MGYIILFIAIIVLAIYLIAFIISAIPLWGTTLIVMLLTLLCICFWKVYRLNSLAILSRILQPSIMADRIEWLAVDSEIQSYSDPFKTFILCILTSTGACWLAVEWLSRHDYFRGKEFFGSKIPPQTEILTDCILTAIITLWTFISVKPRHILKRAVRRKIVDIRKRLDAKLSGLSELATLELAIISVSSTWGVAFPVNYSTEIREYIENHKVELLKNLDGLNLLLSQKLSFIMADRQDLEKAYHHFTEVLSLHERTSREVFLSRSILLIKEMEKIYEGLQSPNIKIMVERKQWADYHRILDMMLRKIDELNDLAIKYSASGQEAPDGDIDSEMSEEKAYQVLGLSSSASIEQIKKVFRKLAEIYHPDKNIIQDDHRMKLIVAAYNTLKNARGFS